MSTELVLNIENLTRAMTGEQATDWMLPLFWSLARKYPQAQIGEIGMRGGTSTLAFLLGVMENGGHVHSMDIASCNEARQMFANLGLSDRHTFTQGDSSKTDFPPGVTFDILFIDGDHRYEAVKADYLRHSNRVKDGGIILFHDTQSCPGVGIFVKEIGGFDMALGAGLGIKMTLPINFNSDYLC